MILSAQLAAHSDPDYEPIPPVYEARTDFDIINIDNGDLVETLDTIEDAREFINLHPDAKLLVILDNASGSFVD